MQSETELQVVVKNSCVDNEKVMYLIPVEFTKFIVMEGSGRGYSFVPAGEVKLVAQWNILLIVIDPRDPLKVASHGRSAAENNTKSYITWYYPLTNSAKKSHFRD